jgi:hypothetical protein
MLKNNPNIYKYYKNILKPDMNVKLLHMYHVSSKALIPLTIGSFLTNYYLSKYENNFHSLNVINIGYHSYFSTSSIITDYIKHPRLSNFIRISSLNMHIIGSVGLVHYIYSSEEKISIFEWYNNFARNLSR